MRLVWFVGLLAASGVLITSVGCKKREPQFTPPPPPAVSVAHPIVRTVPQSLSFTGNVRGSESVEVRARVRGYIQSRNISGGEKVKAGDLLFVIDPRPFEAAVSQAKADVSLNEARLRLAQITLERKQQSAAQNAVSKLELDQAVADRDAAQAQFEFSQAKLQIAELDLDYTQVRAPIDGRLSVRVPDVGELVGDTSAQVLCTIINDETIYVTFAVPEQTVLALRRKYTNNRPGEGGRPLIPVYIGFANDGDRYPFVGRYERGDPGFNPATGTTLVEAVFDNRNGAIVSGAFARVKAVVGEETVTLVPDAAVGVDQSGRYLLTLDEKNTVVRLPVDVGDVIDRMRSIRTPLPEGTRIVINGLQRARPGAIVNPTLVDLPEPKLDLGLDPAATQPATQPTTGPSTDPSASPSTGPSADPSTQPAAELVGTGLG
jgi:membrane fusion protein, multidrug efflux system